MIKTITASLLVAASFGQVPPTIPGATEPAIPAVPSSTSAPVVPATPTDPTVPSVPAVPATPTDPTVPAVPATPTTTGAPPAVVPPVVPPPANTQWVPVTPTTTAKVATVPAAPTTTALPALPAGEFWGPYGQVCAPSPLKDVVCKVAGQVGMEQYPGFMKCEKSYDCCLCSSVSCGNEWTGCNTFSAGDSGIKGVQDVTIIGRSEQLGGADINCIGIEGCAESKIVGRNIKTIDAAGVLSMRDAVVTVTAPVADFNVDCVGMGGCANMKLEVLIEGPPPGYQCNPALDPVTIEFAAIQCSGQESCKGMELTINNQGCNVIEIQQIECIYPTSCAGAVFNLIGAVEINNCDIRGVPPLGLEACYQGGGQFQGNPQYNPYWVPL